MLHNTGLYGPNEASGTPVNMTPTGQMNIVGNINHLAKLGHGNTPTPSGPYSLGDYGSYHNQFNMGTQIPQYPNHHYQHLGYPGSFSNYNHGAFNEGSYQNGMVPMNLNVHSDHNTNIYNYPYDRTSMESVKSDINKESNIGKMPLNIPQIPNKPYYNNDYVHNDSFHNSNQDLNLSMKPHERLPLDNVRRKKIENTVKLIENILINSTNMNKVTPPESLREKSIDSSCNKSTVSETETEPLLETHEDALSLTMKETKTVVNQERPSIIKSPVTVTEDKSEDSYVDDASIENDDIEKPDEDSTDEGDVKPVIPTAMLEVETSVNVLKDIEIKVEESFSWTDTDYAQPFFKDCHVLLRDQVGDLTIVDSETSVNVATTAIQTGLESNICYECPHCSVIIKSPKRFLIHNKWHTFGLTMEKRTELQREREEKRNQRREAKILERMKAEELTDKKNASKAWPCKDCEKVFGTKGSLKNHRQREHPSRVRECRICHKPVIGWIALRNHMATHVADTGAGFQCHKCPKKFKYSHSLAKHSDTHLEKTHGCAECPKKFGSQTLLKMHMKSHERHHRGTTFRCTYCAKGFYEAYTLQVHERTHRNERPFLCEICKTSFGTNSSLKRHLKVSHSTSKPFECPVCHRSFSTEAIRDRHQLRLHGKPEDFKFPCKLCHCKYGQLKDLQKHVYKAHPKNKRKKKVKDEDLSDDSE